MAGVEADVIGISNGQRMPSLAPRVATLVRKRRSLKIIPEEILASETALLLLGLFQ